MLIYCATMQFINSKHLLSFHITHRVPDADLVLPPNPLPPCNFQDNGSVLQFAAAYEAWGGRCHLLLNCAGDCVKRLRVDMCASVYTDRAQTMYTFM